MKMKLISLFILTILLTLSLSSKQSVVLSGLNRPTIIDVDENHIYLVDDTSVLIYSLKDFTLVKKIGRKGEGPQEFRHISSLSLSDQDLIVNSRNKVSFFSKDGIYDKEIKVTSGSDFIRVGDQFIGMDMVQVDKIAHITVNLYDGEFKLIKEINRQKGLFLGSKDLDPILIYGPLGPEYQFWKGKVLVKSDPGVLKIMEVNGTLHSTISLGNEKVAVTAMHREKILDFYRTNFRTKENFSDLKKKFKFPDYFPPIRNYHVDSDLLYILTFKEKNGAKEVLVYDANGKFLKRVFLPFSQTHILELFPYTIKNGTLYQLEEFEDEWGLVATSIK